ncbi:type II toxin-antitoxin system prevent-host-death family antitoxin [Schleiferilactobacillus perolens]|jgi:prevent-host-death family protein|uniref:type II toxin-antitoxin system prevent-host-death family antitoxin n=1 Tax=Schleiferilactobacillus perolens TaxID=100468 RepID=UPI0023545141|nr:type II toxin-antitoxin system prevent-host-death family antitoxin [Schleiferilactobacillus perolens]MCI2170860.1 type II toxin-antitoxin system prevent-host-death family antitoxin [Schleiferilactobacillus perolens]
MVKSMTPKEAQSELFTLIKNFNRDSQPVVIVGSNQSDSAVLMSKADYDAQQETMALLLNGQIQAAFERQNEESVNLADMMREIDRQE